MSLATRCVACGTVFRVVQDQLRVSSGWVRCGRCGEVFNAIESLVDLDVERPEVSPPASAPLASVHGSRVMEDLSRVSGLGGLAARDDSPAPEAVGDASATGAQASQEASGAPDGMAVVPESVSVVEENLEDAAPAVPAQPSPPVDQGRPAEEALVVPADVEEPGLAALRTPGFVRQADRAARWRRPWVRVAMSGLVVVAAGLLAWQIHLSHHDWLAARWPMLKPWVTQLCAWSGCRIQPPRFIDALVVESSGLVREPGSDGYRLAVSLRNRSTWPVRLPALDLVVTDATGQVVARRVLQGEDLGASAASVGPGAELPLAGVLRLRGAQVTGYTIELFYP